MSVTGPLPRVAVFSLGGTIASTNDPRETGGGVTPRLGAAELIAAVPGLAETAALEAVAFRQTASGDLTFADLTDLAAAIRSKFDNGVDGVVITQGTDTIEETSFALDLLVSDPRPVVVTGAMRNPTLAGADGPANLLAAVQVAASPHARGLGCVVVLNDEIHAARFVRKTNTSRPSTFLSMTVGALGWIVEGRVRIAFQPRPLPHFPDLSSTEVPSVALLKMTLGDDDRLVAQLRALGYAGAVVEGFGGGHVPSPMVPALERLAGSMPVVLASRTGGGEGLTETYSFSGSERDLLGRGLIHAGFLDGLKSRILLSLLLARGAGDAGIRRGFEDTNATMEPGSGR